MPKVRVNAAAKKRLKQTSSGRLKRKRAFRSHILTKKTTKRKRNLRGNALVHEADERRLKSLLGLN